ncbi:MAG: hypothetical protein IJ831_07375 [Spirochaetales bacterium]|nr:hypothetical protein [Spirochaetales bacterium]
MKKTIVLLFILVLLSAALCADDDSNQKGYLGLSLGYQMDRKDILHCTIASEIYSESFALNFDGAHYNEDGWGFSCTATSFMPTIYKYDDWDQKKDYYFTGLGLDLMRSYQHLFDERRSMDVSLGAGLEYMSGEHEDEDYVFHFFSLYIAGKVAGRYMLTDRLMLRAGVEVDVPFMCIYYSKYPGNGDHGDGTFDFEKGIYVQPFIGAAFIY